MRVVKLFTDASYCHKTKVGGVGYVRVNGTTEYHPKSDFLLQVESHHVAEYWAAVIALRDTLKFVTQGTILILYTDSHKVATCVAHIINTTFRHSEGIYPTKQLHDVVTDILLKGVEVIPFKVKSHMDTGFAIHKINNQCDKLARQQMEYMRKCIHAK